MKIDLCFTVTEAGKVQMNLCLEMCASSLHTGDASFQDGKFFKRKSGILFFKTTWFSMFSSKLENNISLWCKVCLILKCLYHE